MRARPAMRRTPIATVVLVSAVVIGCGSTPAAPPTPAPSAVVEHEPTPWEVELGNVDADGTRSLDSSLRLFAMAFGPLPGVDAPDEPGQILSGSPAVRAIRAHLDELTDEQLAAVEAHLALPGDAPAFEIPEAAAAVSGASALMARGIGTPKMASLVGVPALGRALPPGGDGPGAAVDQTFINELAAIVTQGRAALARKWVDFPGGLPIYIGDEEAGALSWWEATGGSAGFQCRIVISGSGVQAGIETLAFSLYHELYHCAQAWRVNLDTGGIPPWVWEGAARYFAQDTYGFDADPAWIAYMTMPDTPLFERSYDAVGFWGHVGYALGADVYLSMGAALGPGSSVQRFAVVGADAPEFIDTWASGLTSMIAPFGRAWRTDGPRLTQALSAPREVIHVGANDELSIGHAAYTNHVYALDGDTDLVRFEIEGHARLGDGTVDTTQLESATFCLTDKGCEPCPDDPAPRQLVRLSDVSLLAVSGGTDGTIGKVIGQAAEPCPTPSPSPTPTPEPSDEDEFCRRYKDLIAWTAQYAGTDFELTQEWAGELAARSAELRPSAPDHLVDEVDLLIRVYGAYADLPEPLNVPFVGPEAARLADAIKAMHDYCGIPFE